MLLLEVLSSLSILRKLINLFRRSLLTKAEMRSALKPAPARFTSRNRWTCSPPRLIFLWRSLRTWASMISKFSPQIWSKHLSPQEMERKKERERKRKRKRKAPKVTSNKGEVNILRRERCFNFKNTFSMWSYFLALHHTISRTLFKIIEKIFLTLSRPSFILATYMTCVVPFLLTHELHIFIL
jgi:hypothetical protein